MAEPGVFEIIHNCRAIRYFRDEPVPDALIEQVLDAAIRAPSGSNRQSWHFVVVTDPEIKKTLQGYYKQSFDVYASMMAHVPPRSGVSDETQARVVKSAVYLSEHLHEAPVLTMRTAFRTLRLTLWDETKGRMIGFREYRQVQRAS